MGWRGQLVELAETPSPTVDSSEGAEEELDMRGTIFGKEMIVLEDGGTIVGEERSGRAAKRRA
jgi:hypothetical protein